MSVPSNFLKRDTSPFRLGNHDPQFSWVTEQDPAMESWRSALAEWVRELLHPAPAMQYGRELIRYLWRCPTVTRDPRQFCRADYQAPVDLAVFLDKPNCRSNSAANMHNGIYRFFCWLLHERPSGPLTADGGSYRNPLSRKPLVAGPARTHRTAMPLALLDALADVLTADDYAWPKTLAVDWITDVHGKRVWCPMRAIAALIKVLLPLRLADVRFLESSEGDLERFTPDGWVTNPTPCFAGRRGSAPQRGFLQRLQGADRTVFFVNTDKGYNRLKHAHHPGRTMPWPQPQVEQAVYELEAWQAQHNPVATPTRWTTLQDRRVRRDPKAYNRQPDAFFLFRDPRGTLPAEPVTDADMRSMWLALMDETERRLKRGDYPALAAAVPRLISARSAKGRPLRAVYDTHTPRVTYATELEKAKVPLGAIAKCLGHSSERMTSHYLAPSDASVAATLSEAGQLLLESRSANLAACEVPGIRSLWVPARSAINPGLSGSEAGGLASAVSAATGFGVCPVGAGRCHVGGPVTADGVHGPAPGGRDRCLRCRFFATSPAHLPGLLDRLNTLSNAFVRCIATYWRREFDTRECEDGWNAAEDAAARSDLQDRFVAAKQRSDEAFSALTALQPSWEAALTAVTRCRAMSHTAAQGVDLVLNGTSDDWAEARAAAKEPDVLRVLMEDARVHYGPDVASADRARQLADYLVMTHCVEPPPAPLSVEDARAVAVAQVAWRERVASAQEASKGLPQRTLWSLTESQCSQ